MSFFINLRMKAILLVFSGFINLSIGIRCYQCNTELSIGEYDPCLYGDERFLPIVTCQEPSVCAAYQYQTDYFGTYPKLSVTRGCQAIRFAATCEDIFNDLRRTGAVLPGQHTCATCSEDLCNNSNKSLLSLFILIFSFLALIFPF